MKYAYGIKIKYGFDEQLLICNIIVVETFS